MVTPRKRRLGASNQVLSGVLERLPDMRKDSLRKRINYEILGIKVIEKVYGGAD